MGLYDADSETGSVAFAKQEFKDVRERNEAEARRQDRFAKKLLAVNVAVQGGNAILNSRADDLERSQVPKRAAYEATIENGTYWRTLDNSLTSEKKTREQYLVEKYYDDLLNQAQTERPNANLSGFQSSLMNKAREQASQDIGNFNKLMNAAGSIPTFEDFNEFYESHNTLPRNIGSWVSNSVRGLFREETPETLSARTDQERARQTDALSGTLMGQNLTDFKSYIEIFRNTSINSDMILTDLASRIEEEKIIGKRVEDSQLRIEKTSPTYPEDNTQPGTQTVRVYAEVYDLQNPGRTKEILVREYTEPVLRGISTVEFESIDTFRNRLTDVGKLRFDEISIDTDPSTGNYLARSFIAARTEMLKELQDSEGNNYFKFDWDESREVREYAIEEYNILFETAIRDGEPFLAFNRSTTEYYINPDMMKEAVEYGLSLPDIRDRVEREVRAGQAAANPRDAVPEIYKEVSPLLFNNNASAAEKEAMGLMLSSPDNWTSDLESFATEAEGQSGRYKNLNSNEPLSINDIVSNIFGMQSSNISEDDKTYSVIHDSRTNKFYLEASGSVAPISYDSTTEIEVNESNLALESRKREGRGRQRTLEWQAPPIDVLETAIQDVDFSSLTAGELEALAYMSDEKIAENLELGENIRLRSPAMDVSTKLTLSTNRLFRTKARNSLKARGINIGTITRSTTVSQEFWDSLNTLLIEGSKPYLQEDE